MNKLVSLLVVSLLLLFSCNQKTQEKLQTEEAMITYNKNAKIVHALFDALEDEDLEAIATFFEEEVKFNPPAFGGKVANKQEVLESYNRFLKIMNIIKANDRDFYPTVDSKFVPDGGVRIYTTWTADIAGKPIGVEGIKAYEVFKFSENNKIIEVDEYMDMTGMINKINELITE